MTAPPIEPPPGIDPVRTAGLLAGAAGLASVGWPYFAGMTAALAALALLGWLARPPREGAGFRSWSGRLMLGATFGGWLLLLAAPSAILSERALLLGLSAAAIGWMAGRPAPFGGVP